MGKGERSDPRRTHPDFSDSSYRGVRVARPGCRDPRIASSDTVQWASYYRLRGDTLTLYEGGGNETFESYNGRVFQDSVVQIFIEPIHINRYGRRRGTR